MLGITAIGHVAIKISDLDRTLEFYQGRLGFPEMFRLHNDDGTPWLIYLRITDTQYLEIFPGAETDRAPGKNANAINHVCLSVVDLEHTVQALQAQNIPLTSPIKTGRDGNIQAWIEDPDGNRIELMQMRPDCRQLQAIRAMGDTRSA